MCDPPKIDPFFQRPSYPWATKHAIDQFLERFAKPRGEQTMPRREAAELIIAALGESRLMTHKEIILAGCHPGTNSKVWHHEFTGLMFVTDLAVRVIKTVLPSAADNRSYRAKKYRNTLKSYKRYAREKGRNKRRLRIGLY